MAALATRQVEEGRPRRQRQRLHEEGDLHGGAPRLGTGAAAEPDIVVEAVKQGVIPAGLRGGRGGAAHTWCSSPARGCGAWSAVWSALAACAVRLRQARVVVTLESRLRVV